MTTHTREHYRPDIDGLRAVAILLVLLFHAGFTPFSGGFIGVDVFFVISGYLITSIISREIREGRFTFRDFYARRIRRIIPVLVVVLLTTTAVAGWLFFADDLEVLSRVMLHSFLSTANFHLWIEGRDYFSPDTTLSPLLHVWSLATEEQFYMVWPILLITLISTGSGRHIGLILMTLIVLTLALSQYMSVHAPSAAYFLLPARAFELLIGCTLAMTKHRLPVLPDLPRQSLAIAGMILIIVPAMMLTEHSAFPGLNAFAPCLGAAIIIYCGNAGASTAMNSLLSTRPFVFTGLISYSLYLWHWPIIVFITYSGIEMTGSTRYYALISAFLLSILSWRFVEIPFHFERKWDFRTSMRRIILPSFITIVSCYALIDGYDGFPSRHANLPEYNKDTNFPNRVRAQCFDKHRIGNIDDCWLGVRKEELDGMLIGDSFGNHTAAFLDVLARDAGLFVHDSTAGAYPLTARIMEDGRYDKDPAYAEERLAYARRFEYVFIAANWDIYAEPSNPNYNILLDTIGSLVEAGKTVVVFSNLRPVNKLTLHQYKLYRTRDTLAFDNRDFSIPYTERPDDFIVNEIGRRYPEVIIIDPNPLMCDSTRCQIEIDGSLIYRSEDHINTSGGRLLGETYLKQIGNPLRSGRD